MAAFNLPIWQWVVRFRRNWNCIIACQWARNVWWPARKTPPPSAYYQLQRLCRPEEINNAYLYTPISLCPTHMRRTCVRLPSTCLARWASVSDSMSVPRAPGRMERRCFCGQPHTHLPDAGRRPLPTPRAIYPHVRLASAARISGHHRTCAYRQVNNIIYTTHAGAWRARACECEHACVPPGRSRTR